MPTRANWLRVSRQSERDLARTGRVAATAALVAQRFGVFGMVEHGGAVSRIGT
ncbi:MAG: hypothetical protein ACRD29_20275 [Acidimicrobiales bacterium]